MTEIPKNIDEAWGLFNSRRFQHGRDESMYNSFSTALAGLFVNTPPPVDRGTVPCECTKVAQEDSCPIGYPSLLCDVCDGKGHVPAVKLDGPELWEIVFGIANDVASEITDEQYQKIADAINSVFVDPVAAPASQVTAADYATRLFDLHGFMLLETYKGKHAVTVTFPDLQEAQQFHGALVELSTHRPRPRSLMVERSDNG